MLFIIHILHENMISSLPATLPGVLHDTLRNKKSKTEFEMKKKVLCEMQNSHMTELLVKWATKPQLKIFLNNTLKCLIKRTF